ncbi:MAG: hypothetical protein IT365_06495 [Candidatus Hydrogenedentes bacterium]|nr:hypothetical protein [Candidatus Hydrogenedentota bacterium]
MSAVHEVGDKPGTEVRPGGLMLAVLRREHRGALHVRRFTERRKREVLLDSTHLDLKLYSQLELVLIAGVRKKCPHNAYLECGGIPEFP